MRGDVGGDVQCARAACSIGTRCGDCRAPPRPSRRVAPARSVPALPARRGRDGEVRRVPIAHARERRRTRPTGPRRTAGSSRTAGSACRSAPCSATTIDLPTSESSCASIVDVVGARRPPRCSAGRTRRRTPRRCAAAAAHRRRAGRTTIPLRAAASAGARAARSLPRSSRKRAPSRSRTSIALMAAMRAAASSMPSGSPSRVSQISVTASAVRGSCNAELRAAPRERARRTAARRRTRLLPSPRAVAPSSMSRRRPRGTRETSRAPGRSAICARIALTAAEAAESTCSQLSITHQRPAARQRLGDGVDEVGVAARSDPQRRRDRRRHRRRVADGRELDQPDAVGELVGKTCSDLEREPSLADTAGPPSVTSRLERTRSPTSTSRASRPTKDVGCSGQVADPGRAPARSGTPTGRPSVTSW